jgi:hypothetical protein
MSCTLPLTTEQGVAGESNMQWRGDPLDSADGQGTGLNS